MRVAFLILCITALAMIFDRRKERLGELLIQSSYTRTQVVVRQAGRIVIPATERRSLTLPPGEYEVDVVGTVAGHADFSEQVTILPGGRAVVRLKTSKSP